MSIKLQRVNKVKIKRPHKNLSNAVTVTGIMGKSVIEKGKFFILIISQYYLI